MRSELTVLCRGVLLIRFVCFPLYLFFVGLIKRELEEIFLVRMVLVAIEQNFLVFKKISKLISFDGFSNSRSRKFILRIPYLSLIYKYVVLWFL